MCFNEKDLKTCKENYEINDKSIMIDVLDIFLLDTSEKIRTMSQKNSKHKLLKLLYLKNVLLFVENL